MVTGFQLDKVQLFTFYFARTVMALGRFAPVSPLLRRRNTPIGGSLITMVAITLVSVFDPRSLVLAAGLGLWGLP